MIRNVRYPLASGLAVLSLFCSRAWAQDPEHWPTWRGPGLLGVASPKADPPVRWSETTNVKWKVPVPGAGTSSPVIWGDRLFLLTSTDTGKADDGGTAPAQPRQAPPGGRRGRGGLTSPAPKTLYNFDVLCIDRTSGKTLWQRTVKTAVPHEGHHPDHGYASYSPATDGKHVWASFGSRGLHCLDMDGNIIWRKDLGQLRMKMGFGEGSSPALTAEAVIVVTDHEGDSQIVAFEKASGRELWRKPRDEGSSWSTPLVVEVGGAQQVIVNATTRIRSYDAKTGEVIWQCGGQTQNVIPSPVAGHGMVYCTSGFRGSALQAIELGRTGELTGNAIRWQVGKNTPYVPSPLMYGGKVYVLAVNNPILSCYDAGTGKTHYERQRIAEIRGVYASLVAAAGRVYLAGRGGTTAVIAGGETFEVMSINKLDDGFDASPAFIGNEIYLRGRKHLYCIARPPAPAGETKADTGP